MASNYLAKGLKRSALTIALGLCFAGGVQAQSTSGAISGSAPAGSTVTISNNSGLSRTITVDASGRFNAGNLPVGDYAVTSGSNKRNVTVTLGGNAAVAFGGGDATTLGTVTVTAAGMNTIDVNTVSTSTVLTAKELSRLPLTRSAEAVALLAPGAVAGNSVFFGNVVSFGGSSVAENAYYINGMFTGNPMTNVGGYTLPYGSIEQQETYTGGYSAKYGRSNGGVINQVGKSGTNEFHFGAQVTWKPRSLQEHAPDRYMPNDTLPAGYEYTDPTRAGKLFSRGGGNENWSLTYSGYVSGPLIKDRLFGFLSVEQEKNNSVSFPSSVANPRVLHDESKNPKLYAKLNWNINDNNLLEATYMAQNYKYGGYYNSYVFDTNAEGSASGAFPAAVKENDEFTILKYTGYLTDNLTLSALYGHSRLSYSFNPTLTGSPLVSSASLQNPAYWPAGTPASGLTNKQVDYRGVPGARDYGDNLRVELEWILGSHTLTAGIDNQDFKAKNEGQTQIADRWIYARTSTANMNNPINSELDVGAPGQRYYVRKFRYFNVTNMSLAQKGWYLEDKWQVTDRMLLSLGLRNDKFTNKQETGAAYVKTGNQWAPRLGFSWDVFGDSSFKVFGNAGRYYLALPQAVAVRGASASTYTSEYFTYSGIAADGTPTGLTPILNVAGTAPAGPVSSNHENGRVKDANSFTPIDLKSSYQDEFILGFQSKLTESWNFGAKLTYRNLKAAMDDVCSPDLMAAKLAKMGINPDTVQIPGIGNVDGGCFIVNVGATNTFSFPNVTGGGRTSFEMTPSDWQWVAPMKRSYKALDLFVERPFDGKWEARVDYTFAKSYGNMEGPANSDTGQGAASHDNGVSTSQNWDFPQFMLYSIGYLPNDRRHQIKVRGSYAFNDEWMISGNVRIMSGMPITCWGYLNDKGGDPATNESDPSGYDGSYYHTCFGKPSAPGKEYTPWTKKVDLGLTYKPAFLDHKLELSLNVINVFNERKATAIDGTTEDSIATVSNTYGMPLRFQTPRYVMINASYNW